MRRIHLQIGGKTFTLGGDGVSRDASLDGIVLGGNSTAPHVAKPFEEGKKAFGERKYDTALAYFAQELKANPKNAWACYYVGRTYAVLGVDEHAEAMFGRAVELRPAFATQDYEETLTHITKNDYTKALWAIERASDVARYVPKTPRKEILETANKVGVVFKEGKIAPKDYNAAKRAFSSALAVDPNYVSAHYHLGTIAYAEKNYTTAREKLENVVTLDPKHKWAHFVLYQTNTALGNPTAQHHLEQAARLGHPEAAKLIK